mmetsp:Transcript_10875/g.17965  ORF Transcript_10875/g.17965 Transcript_10875/m.17965 type:complete len:128 (+) Transcript_10875:860-1243(+)
MTRITIFGNIVAAFFFFARFCFGWVIAISTTCAIFWGVYVGLSCHLTLFQAMLNSACVYVLMQLRRSFLRNCLELLAGVRSVRCGWRSPVPRLQFAEPWVFLGEDDPECGIDLGLLARAWSREPEEC